MGTHSRGAGWPGNAKTYKYFHLKASYGSSINFCTTEVHDWVYQLLCNRNMFWRQIWDAKGAAFLGHSLVVKSEWVSLCLEPSQPRRITSGLKTNVYLSLKLFSPQVTMPQVSFSQTTTQVLSIVWESKPRKTITHFFKPICIPRALNMGTCIEQGDLFYLVGLHRNQC